MVRVFSFVPRAAHEIQCTMLLMHVPRNSAMTWTVQLSDLKICSKIQIDESAIVGQRP